MRSRICTALLLAGVLAAPLSAQAQWRGRPDAPDPAAQNLIQQFNRATAPIAQREGRRGRFDDRQEQFDGRQAQFDGQRRAQQQAQQQAQVRAQQEQYNRNLLAQQQAYNQAKLAQQQQEMQRHR
jgi:hypothetical protein